MTPDWYNCPVMMKDGRMGMVIRDKPGDPEVGIQVDGDPILFLPRDQIEDAGGGALVQRE